MPLDPEVEKLLDDMARDPAPPLETMSPEEARQNMRRLAEGLRRPEGGLSVGERSIPGAASSIPARVYRLDRAGALPVLVWFHGGGWVIGDLETHDALCRHLALAGECVVLSVDYRLAPEHPFPAAAEDAWAAARWAAENAASLGGDARRLVVGGDSAGGNLAAVAGQLAKARGEPRIDWQLLVYPITDCDLDTPSYRENASGYGLTRAGMEWFWNHYVPDPAERVDPRAAPLRAAELEGLPPALVITAEYDPLRDEGEAYARRLRDAGVDAVLERQDGMIHGFLRQTDRLERSRVMLGKIARELRRVLGLAR